MTKILTVEGEISPELLGVTDAHNHIWIDPVPGSALNSPVLNQRTEILAELIGYVRAGGQTILDCQPAGCGRNAVELFKLSQQSQVTIIVCTGFHRKLYYEPNYWIWREQVEAIAHHFIYELRVGVQETIDTEMRIRAGFIKIACEETLQSTYRPALEAAAIAAVETGVAMEIHTEKGADAENIARFFLERGVKASQIILCHMDKRPDVDLHRSLAKAGLFLEYDTFYRPKYQTEKFLWPLITEMVEAGLEKQVVLATDMADMSMWARLGAGGPGLANYPKHIRRQLLEKGFSASCVNNLMGANISRCLAQI